MLDKCAEVVYNSEKYNFHAPWGFEMQNFGNGYKSGGVKPFWYYRANKYDKNKKRKRGPLARFLIVLLSAMAVFSVLVMGAALAYSHIIGARGLTPEERQDQIAAARDLGLEHLINDQNIFESFIHIFEQVPTRTNFLLLGLDFEVPVRADAIMVGSFNSENSELTLISIPRDTRVTLSDEMMASLADHGRTRVPRTMRINELFAHAGVANGPFFMVSKIQDMLGINIQYYAVVETDGFEFIVDAIGGIYYEVPRRMLHWYPEDGYFIDLHPGYQLLNGRDALGLVQFRGYARADLQRVEVQQDFMRVAIQQLLGRGNIVSNIGAYIELAYSYVSTNIPFTGIIRYFNAFRGISGDNIRTYTLPLDMRRIGAFVYMDPVATADLVQDVFYGIRPVEEVYNENHEDLNENHTES